MARTVAASSALPAELLWVAHVCTPLLDRQPRLLPHARVTLTHAHTPTTHPFSNPKHTRTYQPCTLSLCQDEGLERWPDAGSAANIGIMLFRPKGHDLAKVSVVCFGLSIPLGLGPLCLLPACACSSTSSLQRLLPAGPHLSRSAQEWVDVLEKDDKVWDQNAFNDLYRRGARLLPDRTDRLFE